MNIDLVLVSLQAFFISLYGAIGFVQSKYVGNSRWLPVLVSFLTITMLGFFFPDQMQGNIQLILFLLLMLEWLFEVFGISLQVRRLFLASILTFLSYGLLYFQSESTLIWFSVPLIFSISFILVKKWKDRFEHARTYFLRSGTLLTVFAMLEPVFISVQQNLKPIPTIPISSIFNQQNFLLLVVLLALVLGGFFWKEKSRL